MPNRSSASLARLARPYSRGVNRSTLKRRTPLRRRAKAGAPRAPLKRKSYPRRKAPRRTTRQVREPEYLAWLHTQSCAAWVLDTCCGCKGRIEAHHAGVRGVGQRAPDATAIPLCVRHHREPGFAVMQPFLTWSKAQRRAWVDGVIGETRARVEIERTGRNADCDIGRAQP